MVLCDRDIRLSVLEDAVLGIEPFHRENLQPASYDLTLGDSFAVLKDPKCYINGVPTSKLLEKEEYETFSGKSFTIEPLSFVLATTKEWVEIPNTMTAFIEGRSSIGRKGLFIHNAGYIDPGFQGNITLELFNATRRAIIVEDGTRICQMIVMTLTGDCDKPYKGKYQRQVGTTGSLMHMDKY